MKKSEINLQRFRDGLCDAGDNYGYLCACYNIARGKEYLIRIYDLNMSKLVEKYVKKRDIDSAGHPEELALNVFSKMLASVGIDISKNEEQK